MEIAGNDDSRCELVVIEKVLYLISIIISFSSLIRERREMVSLFDDRDMLILLSMNTA